jgi:hypothetical protein
LAGPLKTRPPPSKLRPGPDRFPRQFRRRLPTDS